MLTNSNHCSTSVKTLQKLRNFVTVNVAAEVEPGV